MSSTYIHEPPTNGKVLLRTSCGDIDIELWSKETPKACRNFVQLCLEGYYHGTTFHRIIRGFMAQGGDPTGTGEGGQSSYGHTFKDEFHSRLKFVRRGLVAMANAGPNDNGSQFFFTFDRCEHLNNKHTIFGKVVGNTIYNMIKLAEVEIGPDDTPIYPPVIKSTEVLANPFDDIVPRQLKKDVDKEVKKKSKSKATKNFSLLSFGEEAEEDEEEVNEASIKIKQKHKSKSAHDLSNDPHLSSVTAVSVGKSAITSSDEENSLEEGDIETKTDDNGDVNESMKKLQESPADEGTVDSLTNVNQHEERQMEEGGLQEECSKAKRETLRQETQELKREIREVGRRQSDLKRGKKDEETEEDRPTKEPANDMMSEFRQQKKKFRQLKKNLSKGENREAQTLAILAKFQAQLHQVVREDVHGDVVAREDRVTKSDVVAKEDGEEDDVDDDEEDEIGTSWMAHSLHFDAHSSQVKDANIKDADTYSIYDPRNPMNKRRRDEGREKTKMRK